jgi:hypothetical protein
MYTVTPPDTLDLTTLELSAFEGAGKIKIKIR